MKRKNMKRKSNKTKRPIMLFVGMNMKAKRLGDFFPSIFTKSQWRSNRRGAI